MAKDLITDPNDRDLMLVDGDLVFDEANAQNIEALVMLSQGDLKYSPLTGCNAIRLVNGKLSPIVVTKTITLQLRADGFVNENVSLNGANIYVTAERQ
jgi:hypothetical protein